MSIINQNELMRYLEPTIRVISSITPGEDYLASAFNSFKPTGTQTPTSSTRAGTDLAAKYKDAEDLKTADINAATTERDDATTKVTDDYDATVDRLNASYDRAANLLKSKYLGQLKRLEIAKSQSEQTANINYQKLLKYLPERLSAQGLSGLGTSQGAYIRATNDLNNRLVDVMGKYTEGRTAADNEYSAGLTSIEDTRAEGIQAADDRKSQALQAIADRYLSRETAANSRYDTKVATLDKYKYTMDENDKLRAANEAALNVQNAKDLLAGGYFKSGDEVRKWYDANKGSFGDSEDYISTMVESIVGDFKEIDADNKYNDQPVKGNNTNLSLHHNKVGHWGLDGTEDTFWVNVDGEELKLEADDKTADVMVEFTKWPKNVQDYINGLDNNSFCIYNNRLFFKTTYTNKLAGIDRPILVEVKKSDFAENYKKVFNLVNTRQGTSQ